MNRTILRAYDGLLTACGFASGIIFVCLAILISLDVLLRNLGLFSSASLLEVTEYALYITTFIAAPWVLRQTAHVRVDLVIHLAPRPVARLLDLFANAAGLAVSVLLGWHGWRVMLDSFTRGDVIYKQLVIAEWPLLTIIPISCTLLAIEFMRRIVARPEDGGASLTEGF